jgi:hypothetical protein
MPSPRSRPTGLTRLEFAVAVALIGVLFALALPRLAEPRMAARQVRLKMLAATAQTSASLFNGRCAILQSRPDAAPNACDQLPLEGHAVMGVHEWPAASADGIAAALRPWSDTSDIDWQSDRLDGVPALRARLKPISAGSACEFVYVQAASPGAAPRITLVDSPCS